MQITNFEAYGLVQVEQLLQEKQVHWTTLRELLKIASISFVLEGINRWQSTMLCELKDSYVQQSQRYVTMSADGYVLPASLQTEDQKKAQILMQEALELYAEMTVLKAEAKGRPKPAHYIHGIAVEDARYILPLSMKTNISVAMAGDKLLALFQLLQHPVYGCLFTDIQEALLPLLPEKLGSMLQILPVEEADEAQLAAFYHGDLCRITPEDPVVFLRGFSDLDLKVGLGALTSSLGKTPGQALADWGAAAEEKAQGVAQRVLGYGHESVAEQARTTFGILSSLVTYHQQERHRLPETWREPWPLLLAAKERPTVIPPSIADSKFADRYQRIVQDFLAFQQDLAQRYTEPYWVYFLLNCQQIKIITTTNARMDCGMLRERICRNAQWEIRSIAEKKLQQLQSMSSILYRSALPSCVYGPCKEGKMTCGQMEEMRKTFAANKKTEAGCT